MELEAVNEKKRKGDAALKGAGEELENSHPATRLNPARKRRLQGGGDEHENSHPATRQNAAKRRLQGEVRSKRMSTEPQARMVPSRTASAAAAANKTAAGSRASSRAPPPASSNKTEGWVR